MCQWLTQHLPCGSDGMVAGLLKEYIDQSHIYFKMYLKYHFLLKSSMTLFFSLWENWVPHFSVLVCVTGIAFIILSSGYRSSCQSLRSLWASWKRRSCHIYTWIFKNLAQCYMLIELICTNYLQCPYLEGKKKANL